MSIILYIIYHKTVKLLKNSKIKKNSIHYNNIKSTIQKF